MSLRPGITDEHLSKAGVRSVAANEAENLCGLKQPGLWIPYQDLDGNPVLDDGREYGRLRLDHPTDNQKYHQRAGSSVHAYMPPGLAGQLPGGDLIIIEGEFKSLSLDEAGLAVIGISGFYGFGAKDAGGEWSLLPEVERAIQWIKPARILFVGDSDTAFNHHFAQAAAIFASLIFSRSSAPTLLLPRLEPGGPKGVDDLAEALQTDGKSLVDHWPSLTAEAIWWDGGGGSWESLALVLLERGLKSFKGLRGAERDKAQDHALELIAGLSPLNQGVAAKLLAKAVGATAGDVRKAITVEIEGQEENTLQGSALEFEEVEPAREPVDGEAQLDALRSAFSRIVHLPAHADVALALWTLHTYAFERFAFSAVLSITSPEKRCGKSTLLELLAALVSRPLLSGSISGPAVFRVIESSRPTLLIDENDSVGDEAKEALRNVVNTGFTKAGCTIRCVGEDFEPRKFSTYCPKALAAIGELAGTIADRAIPIRLARKPPTVRLAKLRSYDLTNLRRGCVRWVKDHGDQFHQVKVSPLSGINDRANDIWEPLFILATEAGPRWLGLATEAAQALHGDDDNAGTGEMLLADIRQLFTEESSDRLSSEDLCKRLAGLESRPWAEWGKQQKPITPPKLARLLKRFGVQPRVIRLPDGTTPRGYHLDQFEDAFSQYLALPPVSNRNTGTTPANIDDSSLFKPQHPESMLHFEKCIPTNKDGLCAGVALSKGGEPGISENSDSEEGWQ